MNKFDILKRTLSAIILAILLFFILLMARGNEDNWICVSGKWIKHGNPTAPMPIRGCN